MAGAGAPGIGGSGLAPSGPILDQSPNMDQGGSDKGQNGSHFIQGAVQEYVPATKGEDGKVIVIWN